jgi:hypothetical protein
LHYAIAAKTCGTVVRTTIRVDHVAVIALLDSSANEAIAAESVLARRANAGVGIARVAVVTLLDAGPDEAIPAYGILAIGADASVRIAGVAVVALLRAGVDETVAANGVLAATDTDRVYETEQMLGLVAAVVPPRPAQAAPFAWPIL